MVLLQTKYITMEVASVIRIVDMSCLVDTHQCCVCSCRASSLTCMWSVYLHAIRVGSFHEAQFLAGSFYLPRLQINTQSLCRSQQSSWGRFVTRQGNTVVEAVTTAALHSWMTRRSVKPAASWISSDSSAKACCGRTTQSCSVPSPQSYPRRTHVASAT